MSPHPSKKYPTYEALAEAFRSGELDPAKYRLFLDNDVCFLGRVDVQDANDECRNWFWGNGNYDLEDAVRALGIPCEPV